MANILEEAESKTKVVADVDLNSIFYQLHDIAKNDYALKVKPGYELMNLGISEVKKTFIGACESAIVVSKAEKELDSFIANYDQKSIDILKEDCFQILKTYVQFFIGEQQSNELKKDELQPIEKLQDSKNESVKIDYKKSLLENIFEAEEDMDPDSERSQEDYDQQATASDANVEDDSRKADNTNTTKQNSEVDNGKKYIIGYSLQYQCNFTGKTKLSFQKVLQWAEQQYKNNIVIRGLKKGIFKLADGIFGSTIRDFQKLSFNTFGNNKINIGQTVSNTIKGIAKLAGKTFGKQDFAKVIDLFKSKLNKKFNGNKLVIEPKQLKVLTIDLRQQGKYDSAINDKVEEMHPEYVISIQASKSDKFYSQYSISNFVKYYNEAVKESSNIWTRLKLKESDVILIKDYNPNNEVKPDNLEDKNNESVELKVNNFMTMIFENFHDYVSLTEGDSELENNFKQLFFVDDKLNKENLDAVIDKLNNDSKFDENKISIGKIKDKAQLIDKLSQISDEKTLNQFISRYQSQTEKLKYMYQVFAKYLDKSISRVDAIVDQFIIDGKLQKSRLQHIAKMFKSDTQLSDDYFEIDTDAISIKSKKDFCDKLTACKDKEQLHDLFDNYSTPATLKLFNDKITEYFRKNRLQKADKVDLYLIFKKHTFEQNLDQKQNNK